MGFDQLLTFAPAQEGRWRVGKVSARAKPSVSKDEPLILKATYQDCASIAQFMAMYPRLMVT